LSLAQARESIRKWFLKAGELLSKKIKKKINNSIIYTDGGPWYIWPMKFLKLRHRRKTFGIRNSIESWLAN
jgi:transposase-like protein